MGVKEFFNPEIQRRKLILENIKNGIILDLGSQEGELHNFLKENIKDSKLIGVDIVKNENVDIVYDLNEKLPL